MSVDPGGIAGVNTTVLDGCPNEGPDGLSLFFASNRPGSTGVDIWVSRRSDRSSVWGAPERLPEPVNSTSNDLCPTPLPGGVLLFVSNRPGGCGGTDIYQTSLHPTLGWLEPEHLGCDVNSGGDELSPSYAGASGGKLFFSSSRTGSHGIYVSTRGPAGTWGTPAAVDELNVPGFNTFRPNVSADGREIVFDSNRPGGLGAADVWSATRPSVDDEWSPPFNLGPNVNSAANEVRAVLSRDGKRLYFGSTRPGFQGNSDIFISTRQ